MHITEIALDAITIPLGRRALDPDAVERLKQSIVAVGLQHPITVAKRDDTYVLVAGGHRHAASRQLGWERIPANIVDLDPLQSELLEIDENLMRSELSQAERDSAITRRKELYEQLHPETKHGSPGVSRRVGDKGERTKVERFTKATADAMGVSESTIQNSVRRGEALGKATLAKVAGTSLDKGAELDALAKLPKAQQDSLVARAAAGGPPSRRCNQRPRLWRRKCL
jgi:ParB family transcriptional regulator, chromosome partitioning protein